MCARGSEARPLLSGARRVLVDGHPICEACGRALEQIGPDRWRHAGPGGPKRAPSPGAAALCAPASYAAFRRRFPLLAQVGEDEWREARSRLQAYGERLAAWKGGAVLGPSDNPYRELVGLLGGDESGWRLTPRLAQLLDLSERRRELASLFSWAIPTEAALAALARHGPLVECGAGAGYWAALMRARGIDVLAYDADPPGAGTANRFHRAHRAPWTEVLRAQSARAARRERHRALLLCWPPYDDDGASYGALRAYPGDVVIHVGERDGGATGSVRFHRELGLNWTLVEDVALPHWPRLRDTLSVYRRNAERRALRERDRCFECARYIPTGAIGRCDVCFARRPPALALRAGRHRVEYPQEVVDAMPPALRKAFEASPNRIR